MEVVTSFHLLLGWRPGILGRMLTVLALLWAVSMGAAAQTSVLLTELRGERAPDGLYVSAQLKFDLSGAVEEALGKGIPVYFVAEADVFRERWYWSDAHAASARRYMRVSYQPLTRRWRFSSSSEPLSNAGLGMNLGQYYDSLSETLAAVQRLSQWKVADASNLDADARYSLRFRFYLDSSQLPRTMQLGNLGPSEWNLSVDRRLDIPPEAGK